MIFRYLRYAKEKTYTNLYDEPLSSEFLVIFNNDVKTRQEVRCYDTQCHGIHNVTHIPETASSLEQ